MASLDQGFIEDLWDSIVQFIPSKDREDAAEALIKLCDEYGFTEQEFHDIIDDNTVLNTAYRQYFQVADEEDYDDFEDEDDWD